MCRRRMICSALLIPSFVSGELQIRRIWLWMKQTIFWRITNYLHSAERCPWKRNHDEKIVKFIFCNCTRATTICYRYAIIGPSKIFVYHWSRRHLIHAAGSGKGELPPCSIFVIWRSTMPVSATSCCLWKSCPYMSTRISSGPITSSVTALRFL